MKDTKTYPLIIGLLVPVVMVVFIAASVFIPRLFAPAAQYDFIYSVSEGYYHAQVRLYRHYIKENRSVGITTEEEGRLNLSDAAQSPDGFEIGPGTQGSSFFFFYSSYPDYNTMYLKGHGVAQELNLAKGSRPYYSYNGFHFVGWIIP